MLLKKGKITFSGGWGAGSPNKKEGSFADESMAFIVG